MAKTLDEKITRLAQAMLQGCAYAGTGDVLVVQSLLAACGEHIEAASEEGNGWMVREEDCAQQQRLEYGWRCSSHHGLHQLHPLPGPPLLHVPATQAAHQSASVLGLALVAMAEPLGTTMATRSLEHLLQYGDPSVRYGMHGICTACTSRVCACAGGGGVTTFVVVFHVALATSYCSQCTMIELQ